MTNMPMVPLVLASENVVCSYFGMQYVVVIVIVHCNAL